MDDEADAKVLYDEMYLYNSAVERISNSSMANGRYLLYHFSPRVLITTVIGLGLQAQSSNAWPYRVTIP